MELSVFLCRAGGGTSFISSASTRHSVRQTITLYERDARAVLLSHALVRSALTRQHTGFSSTVQIWMLLSCGLSHSSYPRASLLFCLQLEVMLEDNLTLPSNGKLYSKVLNWVQRSLWENGDQLERLMEEVSSRARSLNPQASLHPSPGRSPPSDSSCF